MAAHNGLQARILHALSTRGALQRREILKAVGGDQTIEQITAALSRMRLAGLAERANNQCWRVTAVGRAEAKTLPPAETPVETPAPVPAAAARYEPGPIDGPGITALDIDRLEAAAHRRATSAPRPQDRLTDAADPAVTAALERFARAAQDALDEYVYSVGDRRILDRLMAARDAAREAVEAAQGAAS